MNFIEFDFAGGQIERRLLPSKQRCHFTNNYFNGSMEKYKMFKSRHSKGNFTSFATNLFIERAVHQGKNKQSYN